jgi:hypothetical protein
MRIFYTHEGAPDPPVSSEHFREPLNFQVIENNKAPQVGLEPTTLRLTEGFHVVAGSCGLLLTHSTFSISRSCRVADMRSPLLRFAGCCVSKTANKRQDFAIFHPASRRRRFDTVFQNSFADSPRPSAILVLDFVRSLCSRGERARTKLSTSSSSTGETRTATALPFRVMTTGPSVWDSSMYALSRALTSAIIAVQFS